MVVLPRMREWIEMAFAVVRWTMFSIVLPRMREWIEIRYRDKLTEHKNRSPSYEGVD